jgi:hypothetical protein
MQLFYSPSMSQPARSCPKLTQIAMTFSNYFSTTEQTVESSGKVVVAMKADDLEAQFTDRAGAAKFLGLSLRTVDRMIATGEIPAVKFTGRVMVPLKWLSDLAADASARRAREPIVHERVEREPVVLDRKEASAPD